MIHVNTELMLKSVVVEMCQRHSFDHLSETGAD